MLWIGITLAVLVLGLLLGSLLKKKAITMVTLVLVGAVVAGAAICWEVPDTADPDPDYALLLGYALDEGEPAPELIRRLETALDWLNATQEIPLVVSGGDVQGHGITEAQVMYAWLEDQGADMSRVFMEPEARDTRENISYASVLIKCQERPFDKVLLITSDYHQTRARFLAEKNSQEAFSLSCQTPFGDHVIASVREVYAMISEILGG